MIAPCLIAVSDFSGVDEATAFRRVESVLTKAREKSVLVLLRDYELPLLRRLELGIRLQALTRTHDQHFGVADRADLALALGADALHLAESSIETRDARALVGPGVFLSRACHDPETAYAESDAIVLAPIVSQRHGRPALGLSALSAARARIGSARLYALGGIDAENAAECLAAGADGVAVIGAVFARDDATEFLRALAILR